MVHPFGELVGIPTNPVPEGARAGIFETEDGLGLRHASFPRTGGPHRGTICLVQGRTEFIEKYFETIADFRQRGFHVASFDFRGQGGSSRLIGDRRLGYVDRFSDYVTDITSFYQRVLLPDCPPPFYLVAHSMGGLAAIYAAIADRLMFERVFLSAPMLGLDRQPLSTGGMARLTEMLSFFGLGTMKVARPSDRAAARERFAGNPLTSDAVRYVRMVDILAARPDLEIGAPTLRWAAAAFGAMAETQSDGFQARIKVPMLILAAARDEVVSSGATETFALGMRTGRHMIVPAARHELFMENDTVRAQVFAAFDAFITHQSG